MEHFSWSVLYKLSLKNLFVTIYSTWLIQFNVFIWFFFHILTVFVRERACPKHTYSSLFLTFINIFLDFSKLLAFDNIIRSIMESVSCSYAFMSFRVPDILNVFLRNNYIPNVYCISTCNVIIKNPTILNIEVPFTNHCSWLKKSDFL